LNRAMGMPVNSIGFCADRLAKGELSSRELLDQCLLAIDDARGEGARAFTKVYRESAVLASEAQDRARAASESPGLLAGIPISIKDLFDVAGEPNPAGSVVLANRYSAVRDAEVVTRLRASGAVVVGRTNMTEFAYSGLGLNPHYGTPRNPYDRAAGRIPGGSSSGGAVSVADGMAIAAIGSDTGGSIRIPAALCGLTGFKPTARRVSLSGVLPLSPSLDSIGSIAPTVACCSRLDAVLSGVPTPKQSALGVKGLRLGLLGGYVLDDLEKPVAAAFSNAISFLGGSGAEMEDVTFSELAEIPGLNQKGGFAAAESWKWHRDLIAEHSSEYDPRVLSRILRGKDITPQEYLELSRARIRIAVSAQQLFARYDAWVLPTVPRVAPLIAELEANDTAYFEANHAMLRNPSLFNYLDGCSLSLPCHRAGDAPVGLMLASSGGQDAQLLRVGRAVEAVLSAAGCAVPGRLGDE
jgi:aspartyl-tRNA(Asn)/glutamyl-tRNA(Gln) amidotransferase subunit A